MTSQKQAEKLFIPKGMIETHIIEREIQRRHSRYLGQNLKQLARIAAASLNGFFETLLKRTRQRDQAALENPASDRRW